MFTDCGGNLNAYNAGSLIQSPTDDTSEKYPNNARCTWYIRVDEGKFINLQFKYFKLEGGENCPYDFIQVNTADGETTLGK